MATEPVETYPYTAFPLTTEVPGPVYTFQQKHKFFPAEIAINPDQMGFQGEYTLLGPRLQPLAPLPQNRDFVTVPNPLYGIVVVPDTLVAPDTMVCRGRAEQTGVVQFVE